MPHAREERGAALPFLLAACGLLAGIWRGSPAPAPVSNSTYTVVDPHPGGWKHWFGAAGVTGQQVGHGLLVSTGRPHDGSALLWSGSAASAGEGACSHKAAETPQAPRSPSAPPNLTAAPASKRRGVALSWQAPTSRG